MLLTKLMDGLIFNEYVTVILCGVTLQPHVPVIISPMYTSHTGDDNNHVTGKV